MIFRCTAAEAEAIMQQALERFSAEEFDFLARPVTFSYGTAEFNSIETSVSLFDRADQLMYQRKRALHLEEQQAN